MKIIEHPPKRRYFSAEEVGQMIHESSDCVKYWARKFGIRKNQNNVKAFSRNAVARLHIIKNMLRTQGLKAWEVKDRLTLMIQKKVI